MQPDQASGRWQGDAADSDPQTLRKALGSFATGVTVVTTVAPDGRPVGLTASSFNSVSMDPPLILWSLSERSPSLAAFRDGSHFAVNVLADEQIELCSRFGRPVPDKFDGLDLAAGAGGAPLLPGAVAQFECALEAVYPVVFFDALRVKIRGDGVVESAGSLIQATDSTHELPSGLGTRHGGIDGIRAFQENHCRASLQEGVAAADGFLNAEHAQRVVRAAVPQVGQEGLRHRRQQGDQVVGSLAGGFVFRAFDQDRAPGQADGQQLAQVGILSTF